MGETRDSPGSAGFGCLLSELAELERESIKDSTQRCAALVEAARALFRDDAPAPEVPKGILAEVFDRLADLAKRGIRGLELERAPACGAFQSEESKHFWQKLISDIDFAFRWQDAEAKLQKQTIESLHHSLVMVIPYLVADGAYEAALKNHRALRNLFTASETPSMVDELRRAAVLNCLAGQRVGLAGQSFIRRLERLDMSSMSGTDFSTKRDI